MNGSLFIRIDDRLIHGQIVTAWAKVLNIKKIIALDDALAVSEMLAEIMLMGISDAYEPEILTTSAVESFLSHHPRDENVLLVTRAAENLALLKEQQLMQIIIEENLKEKETRKFLESCLLNGEVKTSGKDIDSLLPPMSWFDVKRAEKKQRVIDKFRTFFDRFYGIGDADLSMPEETTYNYDEGYMMDTELALVGEEIPEYSVTRNHE